MGIKQQSLEKGVRLNKLSFDSRTTVSRSVASNVIHLRPVLLCESAESWVYQCYKMSLDPYKEQYCMLERKL